METLVRHLKSAVSARLALIICLCRRVHVKDAVVRRHNVERLTKVSVPVTKKMDSSTGRIARIARLIINVYVVIVDGRNLWMPLDTPIWKLL